MGVEAETQQTRAEQADRRAAVKRSLLKRLDEELNELSPSELRLLSREVNRMARRQRSGSLLESELAHGLMWGAGGVAFALFLFPHLRRTLRPLAVAAATGIMDVVDNSGSFLAKAKDALEDIVAEAQFSRPRDRWLMASVAASAAVLPGVFHMPFLAGVFRTVPLAAGDWLTVAASSVALGAVSRGVTRTR